MSLHGMIFGNHGDISQLVMADLGDVNVGRFRDAWIELGDDGEPRLAVYTRNGGGNRECWGDHAPEEPCTGCIAENVLPAHPRYIYDADDDFDCTYATFYFKPSDELSAELQKRKDQLPEAVDMSERWQAALAAIGKP